MVPFVLVVCRRADSLSWDRDLLCVRVCSLSGNKPEADQVSGTEWISALAAREKGCTVLRSEVKSCDNAGDSG